MGSHINSKTTDCNANKYSSETGYQECMSFNQLQKRFSNKPLKPLPNSSLPPPPADECFPTYGKNSPPVCVPDTTGRCIDSGLMTTTGFPACCNENVLPSCIVSSSNPSSNSAPVLSPVSSNVQTAAANCVAKNPNYPSVQGGCYYNASNPCPSHYETVDTRFGTKMCCAPQDSTNANCFSNKSTFGSSSNNNNNILIILMVCVLLFILLKKK